MSYINIPLKANFCGPLHCVRGRLRLSALPSLRHCSYVLPNLMKHFYVNWALCNLCKGRNTTRNIIYMPDKNQTQSQQLEQFYTRWHFFKKENVGCPADIWMIHKLSRLQILRKARQVHGLTHNFITPLIRIMEGYIIIRRPLAGRHYNTHLTCTQL